MKGNFGQSGGFLFIFELKTAADGAENGQIEKR